MGRGWAGGIGADPLHEGVGFREGAREPLDRRALQAQGTAGARGWTAPAWCVGIRLHHVLPRDGGAWGQQGGPGSVYLRGYGCPLLPGARLCPEPTWVPTGSSECLAKLRAKPSSRRKVQSQASGLPGSPSVLSLEGAADYLGLSLVWSMKSSPEQSRWVRWGRGVPRTAEVGPVTTLTFGGPDASCCLGNR